MTKEQKELLLNDLCARLPYHPPVKIYNDSWEGCKIGEFDNNLYYHHVEAFVCDRIEIEPYLRPMSSMTEEEKKELKADTCPEGTGYFDEKYLICPMSHYGEQISYDFMSVILEWLNSHHFDYRGLIGKGLALEALENMYK